MIINHIPDLIAERGWTIYRFAEVSGLNYRTCRLLALHEKPSIRFDLLDLLCALFSCQPAAIYSYKPNAPLRAKRAPKKVVRKKVAPKPARRR